MKNSSKSTFQILNLNNEKKLQIVNKKKVKISSNLANLGQISGVFGLFLAQNEISGVFGQNFVPDAS